MSSAPRCQLDLALVDPTKQKPETEPASPDHHPPFSSGSVCPLAHGTLSPFKMQDEVFMQAARVTAAYAIMFAVLLIWQGVSKLRLAAACAAKKEPFDRFNDKRMLPYDRTVGNFVEWATPFLCLFWVSMVLTNGATLKWGWVYVGARALYPVMAVNKGIGTVGAKAPILLSTVPGYVALINFIIPTVKVLM